MASVCGRYAVSAGETTLREVFDLDEVVQPPLRSWNVAPTDSVPAVVQRVDRGSGEQRRVLMALRWGLVPSWARRPGPPQINARAETVTTKPMFRRAFAARRCLLPADGYYEWHPVPGNDQKRKTGRQASFIRPESGLLVMAGIYEFWKDPAIPGPGGWLASVAIITARASDRLGQIHDRMPVVVEPADWADWLDPDLTDPAAARQLLTVAGDRLVGHPVSAAVGNVRNNGPELVRPVDSQVEVPLDDGGRMIHSGSSLRPQPGPSGNIA